MTGNRKRTSATASERTAAKSRQAALWTRADWLIAAGLVLLTLISRWPYRTRMLWAWDSGLFALALTDYNVVAHQPQPPGYVFYVGTGKLIAALTRLEANATYVLISMVAASLTVGTLYLLGALLFDRLTGALAAGLGLTSVSFWFFSAITYPYTVLALGSTILGLLSWLLLQRRIAWPWLAALAFGLIAGFRQDLLLFLGPLFVTCFVVGLERQAWMRRAAWKLLGLAAVAGLAGCAVWWIATDLASEGWGSLWRSLTMQSANVERGTSAFATGGSGLRKNATLLSHFGKDALHLAIFPTLAYFLQWPAQPRGEGSRPFFLLLWMGPAIAFYLLVHIGEAGYVFSFLPAVLLASAAGLTRAGSAIVENLPAAWQTAQAALLRQAITVGLALLILPYHVWLFAGGADPYFSAAVLDCRDRAIAGAIRVTRANYPPATTEIVTSAYLQHFKYYLPEYRRVRFLMPDRDATWRVPPDVERVLVFDLEMRFGASGTLTRVPLACESFALAVARTPGGGQTLTYNASNHRLEMTP